MSGIKKAEILAPAGGQEQLEAAVRSGADAVYFGTSDFNARRNAGNFSGENFLQAVRYCRERGVKSYIVLNTLVKDAELEELYKVLELTAESGADAVIIQDLAVYKIIKNCCPSLPVHASTQMAIHNISGARRLEELGFSRIVLARELSLKEIEAIRQSVNIQTEVFVHGAHCMSVSGMCYMSSFFGARSGNRGLCAQPCRLNFKSSEREYALSLKDMSLLEHIPQLLLAGVDSFKIEGRMKRPEYAAAAVTACKRVLAGEKADIETLKSVFSRGGFTDGYAKGEINADMFGFRTKDDVNAAAKVLPELARLYKEERKSVPVNMHFEVKRGMPSALTVSDSLHSVKAMGDAPEAALKVSLDAEKAEKSLTKLGGTFYYAQSVVCDIDSGLMLSAASINALRREALEKLSHARGEAAAHRFARNALPRLPETEKKETRLRLYFTFSQQIPENTGDCEIILPLSELEKEPQLLEKYSQRLTAALPALIYPENESKTAEALKGLCEKGLENALCENAGAIQLAKAAGLSVHGGHLLNILNSQALSVYESGGVLDNTLSAEASFEDIKKINGLGKTGFIAYGHMPLMHFRCCPVKKKEGCGSCTGRNTLSDRRGELFPLLCYGRQYSVLYNPIALYCGDKSAAETDFATLLFTVETKNECAEIIDNFRNKRSLPSKRTLGLYDKQLL